MDSSSSPQASIAGGAPPGLPPLDASARLSHPAAIVFVSNTCIMVLELVAGRLIAPHVGVSLYTWTSVIGMVLAGISLGNYLGGWVADRWASPRLLGGIFLLGGLSSFGILAAERLGDHLPPWPIVFQILALTAALFFVPSMVLGAVSPVVAKLAVRDLKRTGSTLGTIYAAGTVGSIVGTFATGFVLIAWFGTHAIVWGVASVLLALGAILVVSGSSRRRQGLGVAAALLTVAAICGFTASRGAWNSTCTQETSYYCIKVHQDERHGVPVLVLVLDRLVHSYVSVADPTNLIYDYERVFAEATEYLARRHERLSALFIGGGGYTFPRYMEAVYPGSRLDVVEIDPGVTEIAYDRLGLRRDSTIVSYNEDARMFLARPPERAYSLIMGDAFNDFSVPYHLTTKEFNDLVRQWLAPDGIYMVNLIDGARHDFLRAYLYTLRQTFRHVYVVPTSENWYTSPRLTYVLFACDTPLDVAALKSMDVGAGGRFFAAWALSSQEVEGLLAEATPVLLTDDYAPVDQMLAPVIRNEPAPATAAKRPTKPGILPPAVERQ